MRKKILAYLRVNQEEEKSGKQLEEFLFLFYESSTSAYFEKTHHTYEHGDPMEFT